MPTLDQHQSSRTTKMLLLGDSGAGKTGSLASLADAGYNLWILDLDNGLDAFKNYLMSDKGYYKPDAWKNVRYKTLTEPPMKLNAMAGAVRQATVWPRFVNTLSSWEEDKVRLGSLNSWTEQDVLVIDSLSFLGKACFNHAAFQNVGSKDGRMAYFHAQNYVEHTLECLYGDDVRCNVIITAHVIYIGDELQIQHGYPVSIGKALSPKIGRFFNSVLMVKSQGKSRKIFTNSVGQVELKNSAPLSVKAEYDIRYGLAEYFKDVQAVGRNTPPGSTVGFTDKQ